METIYDFSVIDSQGKKVNLSDYKDKVVMIVNTATRCGYTHQLAELEELYQEYKEQGFEIIGFPSNDFLKQEPVKNEDMEKFCKINYGVTFKLMKKVKVKGKNAHPLYLYLGDRSRNGMSFLQPIWNFHKYLIGKDGKMVNYFLNITPPMAKKVKKAIEKNLNL